MGGEKETRFLLLGQRNRVSAVNITIYLWETKKKPGFWGFKKSLANELFDPDIHHIHHQKMHQQ